MPRTRVSGNATDQPALVRLIHERETGKRHGPRSGAVLQEQVGYFDRTVLGFEHIGLDLCPQARSGPNKDPFQRLFAGDLYINQAIDQECDGVVHGSVS